MNKLIVSFAVGTALIGISSPALATSQSAAQNHKVGICHATGSKTNPYVYINVDTHAVQAHTSHQDGRDIINVSDASKCPKAVVAVSQTSPVGGGTLSEATPTTLPETGSSSMLAIVLSMVVGGIALAARKRIFS